MAVERTELGPRCLRDGGTQFLSSSHATRLQLPQLAAVLAPRNQELESYECPAGSAVIWTESLTHAAAAWTPSAPKDRVAIFCMYNSVWARWAVTSDDSYSPSPQQIERMPPKRRTLFRPVFAWDFAGEGEASATPRSSDNILSISTSAIVTIVLVYQSITSVAVIIVLEHHYLLNTTTAILLALRCASVWHAVTGSKLHGQTSRAHSRAVCSLPPGSPRAASAGPGVASRTCVDSAAAATSPHVQS